MDYFMLYSKNYDVVINVNFYLGHYERVDGTRQVLLSFTSKGKRKRVALDLFVNSKDWNQKKQRIKPKAPNAEVHNLFLDKTISKITDIKIHYKLSDSFLSMEKLVHEFRSETPSFDFISFCYFHLNNSNLKESTKATQKSRINSLKEWREVIPLASIDLPLLNSYRNYLYKKGLMRNTVNSHFKTISKFLRLAVKHGMKIQLDLDDLEVKNIRGNRTPLSFDEVEKLWRFWDSEFCQNRFRLPLGYFLFVCKTGLRLGEFKSIQRNDFQNGYFRFYNIKSDKYIKFKINNSVQKLLDSEPNLFKSFISDQKMRDYLKEACKLCGIKKKIDYHTGRHTFATHYVQRGGKPHDLQQLLGHSDIKTTMVYYHPNNTGEIDTAIVD